MFRNNCGSNNDFESPILTPNTIYMIVAIDKFSQHNMINIE